MSGASVQFAIRVSASIMPPNNALETIGVDALGLFIKGFWLLDIAGRRCLSLVR